MAKSTTTARNRAKRPRSHPPEPRYESSESSLERRRPRPAVHGEGEPRLGPYEFRYSIELGYPSPVLG